ncbi:transglutaminase domain-containing protein [Candidatus Woesearchaeota archaeon]|nr:transglutaminase domain-containing protein [Candidatus Woesearchaeota archaeon]
MTTHTRRSALRLLLRGTAGALLVPPVLEALVAEEAEAKPPRTQSPVEPVPVQFNYKTILGNDQNWDQYHSLQVMARQYQALARYYGGEASLTIPEDAAIRFVKDAGIKGVLHPVQAPRKPHMEIVSQKRRGNTIEQVIGFDLIKYIRRDNQELHAIAEAVTKGYQTPEENAQALLCFVQTVVDYDHNKIANIDKKGPNADFVRLPVQTLIDRKGDCKDTSVLYASLLLAAGITRPAFIFYQGHVNVGVQLDFASKPIQGMPEDMYLDGFVDHQGRRFYIAETTPERPMYIGRLMVAQQGQPIQRVKVIQ